MFVDRIGRLSPGSGVPLYLQLQSLLREAIEQSVFSADEALPPERELAEAFSVSRVTVRKAIDGLVDARQLSRRHGAGTYVAARVEKNCATISSFSEDMRLRGRKPHSEWLSRDEGAVSPEEAMALCLSPGSAVYRFARIRFADAQSMGLEYTTVPAEVLPSIAAVRDSLYEALGERRPVRVLQRLRAILLSPDHCGLLQIEPGVPGLEVERRGIARDGRVVEFTRAYYRGDSYDFVSEVSAGS